MPDDEGRHEVRELEGALSLAVSAFFARSDACTLRPAARLATVAANLLGGEGDDESDMPLGPALDRRTVVRELEVALSSACRAAQNGHVGKSLVRRVGQELLKASHVAAAQHASDVQARRKAVEASQQSLGVRHPQTFALVTELGKLLHAHGDFEAAAKLLREALDARREVLGDRDEATVESMESLSAALHAKGDLRVAETFLHEALGARREAHGDADFRTLRTTDALGGVLEARGSAEEASAQFTI